MAGASSIKVDLADLVSSLTKFMAWNDEYQDIRERFAPNDAAGSLMETLGIPREDVRVLIGGSNAPIFKRAADCINGLRDANPLYPKTRADFAALILKGIVCGLKWEMLPDGSRGWRWDGYLRDAEVKELCDFAKEEYPQPMRDEG
jgi:hypothetical protein